MSPGKFSGNKKDRLWMYHSLLVLSRIHYIVFTETMTSGKKVQNILSTMVISYIITPCMVYAHISGTLAFSRPNDLEVHMKSILSLEISIDFVVSLVLVIFVGIFCIWKWWLNNLKLRYQHLKWTRNWWFFCYLQSNVYWISFRCSSTSWSS